MTRHRYSKHELRARRHNSTRHSFKLPAARDLAANIGQAILAIESYASRASHHGMFSTRACIKHARFIQKPPRDGAKRNGSRRDPAGDSNERRGCQLAREFEPWFILVSILSHAAGEFSCTGLAGRLTRREVGGSSANAGWRAAGQRTVSR